MKRGFTDRQHAIMASAAVAKYFLVIDKSNDVESQRSMTGLAHTAGGDVIRRLSRYLSRSR